MTWLDEAQKVHDTRCMPSRAPQDLYGRKLVPIEKDLLARLLAVARAAEALCGALSVWRPVQPPPDPADCTSGYPEWIRKAWMDLAAALGGDGDG